MNVVFCGMPGRAILWGILSAGLAVSQLRAERVTLNWDPNPEPNVTGYFVRYGYFTGDYIHATNVGARTQVTLNDLRPKQLYYFVVTAYNSDGLESDPSVEVVYGLGGGSGNLPPVVEAGENFTVSFNGEATLRATIRDDGLPTPSALSAVWSVAFGPGTATFSDATSPTSRVTFSAPGYYGLRLVVSDGELRGSDQVMATVTTAPSGGLPTFRPIADRSVAEDSAAVTVSFTLEGGDASGAWNLSAASSNLRLIPEANLQLSGTGSTRQLSITPAANQFGNAQITLAITDGRATNAASFRFTVTPANDPPHISFISARTIDEGEPLVSIPFVVSDIDTPFSRLALSASSTNTHLVSPEHLSFGGSGSNRVLRLVPARGRSGRSMINVSVSDGTSLRSAAFLLTVRPANHPPTVSAGDTLNIRIEDTARLTGRVNDDRLPTNSVLNTVWTRVSGPGQVTLSAPESLTTTATFSRPGVYRLRLTASDGVAVGSDDVVVNVGASSDRQNPILSDVRIEFVGDTSARIAWRTDEPTESRVEFGTGGGYGQHVATPNRVTDHRVTLHGLHSSTLYHFRAMATDIGQNVSASPSFSFQTLNRVRVYLPLPTAGAAWSQGAGGDQIISYRCHTPSPGSYVVWCRILATSGASYAFQTSVNGGSETPLPVTFATRSGSWRWGKLVFPAVDGTNSAAPHGGVALLSGAQTIALRGQAMTSSLNRLLVTNDPDWVPNDNEYVAGVALPQVFTEPVFGLMVYPGFTVVANQLNRGGNTLADVLPQVPLGTTLFKWQSDQGNFTSISFDTNGWSNPRETLRPGEGAILAYIGTNAFPLAFTGQWPDASTPLTLRAGARNLVSVPQAKAGSIGSLIDFTFRVGDSVRRQNPRTGSYTTYTYGERSWDMEPVLSLNEAFFLDLQPRP